MTVTLQISSDDLVGSDTTSLARRLSAAPLDSADSLVLEFDERAQLDESGLALLVRLYSHISQSGRRMALSRVPPRVMAALHDVGLDSLFSLEPAQALAMTERAPQPV